MVVVDMFRNQRENLENSAFDFRRVVWPAIARVFNADNNGLMPGNTFMQVEGIVKDRMRSDLDRIAGIDAWVVGQKGGMFGLASRVQWVKTPWNSFTIRKERLGKFETEYKKRLEALEMNDGRLSPHYTIQAYVKPPPRGGKLLSCGIVETNKLIKFIRDGREGKDYFTREVHDARFYVVFWRRLINREMDIIVLEDEVLTDYRIKEMDNRQTRLVLD